MKIQSYSFDAQNESNVVSNVVKVGVTSALIATGALADDPAWYTSLNTQLVAIGVMVVSVLTAVITITLSPLAWTYVKKVINRG